MEIDLAGDEREPAWPAGISVRTVTDADERLVYDLVKEVWLDTSDPIDETFEDWQHWTTKAETFDPSLWFLALDGEDVAGFSLCRQDQNDANAGYVATLGVRRPWRRQGLGEALAAALVSRSSATAGTAARRSVSTRRARPARRGCTSAPACASTATPSFSSGRFEARFPACRASAPAAPTAAR